MLDDGNAKGGFFEGDPHTEVEREWEQLAV